MELFNINEAFINFIWLKKKTIVISELRWLGREVVVEGMMEM